MWSLYAAAIERFGPVPTLIEWDTDIPELAVLEREAATAQRMLSNHASRRCLNSARRFAASLLADDAARTRASAVYRNTVFGNYRNALGATYRVVRELTGAPFFDAAVDAFVRAHPSTGGDLNVYGGDVPGFPGVVPARGRPCRTFPTLRASNGRSTKRIALPTPRVHRQAMLAALAALAGDDVARQRFVLDPSCRLLRSPHPVLRIWQVHQPEYARDGEIDWNAGGDVLLVRREGATPTIERLAAGDYAWLAALAAGADLAGALDAALAADPTFDLGTALRDAHRRRHADGSRDVGRSR